LQYPSPSVESHLSMDSNWSSSSFSNQEHLYTSHSQYQQYNPSVSRQLSSNEHQHLQHLQQPHSHYPAYEGLHHLGLKHVGYPPQPPTNSTTIHYRPPACPAYQSNNILAPKFYEQINQDLPLPIHLSQTHIEQSSASPSSLMGHYWHFLLPLPPMRNPDTFCSKMQVINWTYCWKMKILQCNGVILENV
jgi:hypothetical protein